MVNTAKNVQLVDDIQEIAEEKRKATTQI